LGGLDRGGLCEGDGDGSYMSSSFWLWWVWRGFMIERVHVFVGSLRWVVSPGPWI
jgi:hypothetical protein